MDPELNKGVGFNSNIPPDHKVGDTHILAVGINAYSDAPLKNCVRDTQDFLTVMMEDYDIREDLVIKLFDEEATKAAIFAALDDLYARMRAEDNFIFWFSGHGFKHPVTKMGYWVPAGSSLKNTAGSIPNAEILGYVKAMPARHILLLIDSCFSGTLFAAPHRGETVEPHLLEWRKSRWALTAGREETVSDGQSGTNSPFAEKLLFCLRNHPATRPLFIGELTDFVVDAVGRNANQQPDGRPLQNVDDMGGRFALRRKGWSIPDIAVLENLDSTKKGPVERMISPEEAAFECAKSDPAALKTFIGTFPESEFRPQAEAILEKIKLREANNEKIKNLLRQGK